MCHDQHRRSRIARVKNAALLICICAITVWACAGAVRQLMARDLPALPPRIPAHRALADTRSLTVTPTRDSKKISIESSAACSGHA
jgi:hypothetical protein